MNIKPYTQAQATHFDQRDSQRNRRPGGYRQERRRQ